MVVAGGKFGILRHSIAVLLNNEGPRPLGARRCSPVCVVTGVGLYHHDDHGHHQQQQVNAFQGTSKYLWLVVSGISTLMYIIVIIFTRTFISPNFGRVHFCRKRDISVGIATRYGLDGPGIESHWGVARFSAPVQIGPVSHPATYTMNTGSFLGVKRPGRGVDNPPHLAPSLRKQ